jgi:moderate conductance mechanosensitive channel
VFLGPPSWRLLILGLAPALLLAWVAARLVGSLMKALLRALLRDTLVSASPIVRAPLQLLGLAVFALVFAVLVVPALELAGLHPRLGVHLHTLTEWAFDSGLRVLLIAAVAYMVVRTVTVAVKRFEADVNFGLGLDALERARRARTLGGVLSSITTVIVVVMAVLMIMREFRVDISPALTGAGIVGVALGFGAQSVVKDLIGGFFLILENQVRVGDVASINGTGGVVEAINLRTIVLRDEEGTVHVIPNGSVTSLANLTKDYSYYVIDLPLAYDEDTDAVAALVTEVATAMQREDAFQPFILAPVEIIGVDAFSETALHFKFRIKTAPLKQWVVGRELRRRILQALEERGHSLWSPRRTMAVSTTTTNSQGPMPNAP